MATTKIKCPVEGIIDLDLLPRVDVGLVVTLLDCPELQRLRAIRQLGFTEYVYPGATHTRFAHSLGSFQGAQRALTKLRERGVEIPDHWYVATALACLLHDLGHGPFSHTFESVTEQSHEDRTREIVRGGPEVPAALRRIAEDLPEQVVQLLTHSVEDDSFAFLSELVSSALDCDRMDYLRRDALHTGARYGNFDRDWILGEMVPTEDRQSIVVVEKGRAAVEQYLIGRYHMFQNVYLHKTSRGFEGAFGQLCRRLRALGPTALPSTARALHVLQHQDLPLEAFLGLNDRMLLVEIATLVDHPDPTVCQLARILCRRRPLRQLTSWGRGEVTREELDEVLVRRREAAAAEGLDPDTAVWEDAAEDVPYRPYDPESSRRGLRVRHGDGRLVDITEDSPTIRALAQKLVTRRVYWLTRD